ncbi:MAG: ferredoxin reductase family protein [Candidatus Accumulibacter meliphilus]|uniref:ferredoxin reductase family protein n=1 Tax=Candidatus Accumulibacter meliphilus TaxID=2211374 RepID=UPI002FC27D55
MLVAPWGIASTLGLRFHDVYRYVLSALNIIAMTAFFVQFPLAGRVRRWSWFANIDWGISTHKKIGEWLGIFFFLHPLLILAPKALLSAQDLQTSVVAAIASPNLLTGLLAWLAMLVWVLMAVFRNRLPLRYETWRVLHVLGFVVIATLAVLHVTSVGSHGQLEQQFNLLWWGLYAVSMALVIYNYLIKPVRLRAQPFVVREIKPLSECDWALTIPSRSGARVSFDAGQFVWINTSKTPFNLEQHPFSIASGNAENGTLTFIIRELGDYTGNLQALQRGQTVYVDGPYGSLSVAQSKSAAGITLVAGGAGIAPMLGLLCEFAQRNESRPVRLVYGNQAPQRMVALDELRALCKTMPDFSLQLVCDRVADEMPQQAGDIRQGLIDAATLRAAMAPGQHANWCVYLCGPEGMIATNVKQLKSIGVKPAHIHFEQLSF